MSNTADRELLGNVASQVLEDAAFVFTDELEAEDAPQADWWNAEGVSLGFSGTPNGFLHMWASEGFARYAAANMLGIDEGADDAVAKGMDALKELLNIIVGNYLTRQFGEEPVFDLGIPETLSRDTLQADVEGENCVWMEADGNQVLFTVSILKG